MKGEESARTAAGEGGGMRRKRQVSLLTAVLLGGMVLAGLYAWINARIYYETEALANERQEIAIVIGQTRYLSEVLRTSAEIGVRSDILTNERKYDRAYTELNRLIAKPIDGDRLLSATARLEEARGLNHRLAATERQAFALARVGNRAGARALLGSADYARNKALYQGDLNEAFTALHRAHSAFHRRIIIWRRLSEVIGLFVLLYIFGGWAFSINTVIKRDQAEEIYRESEEKFRTLVETSDDCICRLSLEGNITYMNQAGLRQHEIKSEERIIGVNHRELAQTAFGARLDQALTQAANGRLARVEYADEAPSGIKWFESVYAPLRGADGAVVAVMRLSRDVTERKHYDERIKHMAYHDLLTGLPNRQLLADRLNQALAYARRHHRILAFLFIDLDGFKQINDRYGHESGDRLLKVMAERLTDDLRQSDTVARVGGDEFNVILLDLPEADIAAKAAQKLLDKLAEPVLLQAERVSVSAGIGISLFPRDGDDFDSLVLKADKAMYFAKQAGKNLYRFYQEGRAA